MTYFNPTPNTLKMTSLPGPALAVQPSAAGTANTPADKKSGAWDFSFANLLDIVNPLQHLPVIGTLYRAITGDQIAAPAKIAGDALYGGLWGAVASVANVAFEAVTGKDFGATVLALVTGGDTKGDAPRAIAAAKPAAPGAGDTTRDTNVAALTASLSQKGVSSDIAQRALYAYQRSMTLPHTGASSTVLAAAL